MENPERLIRRAAQKSRLMRPQQETQERTQEAQEDILPAPPPPTRHGTYTALMRSHDRVHTRHIPGRS